MKRDVSIEKIVNRVLKLFPHIPEEDLVQTGKAALFEAQKEGKSPYRHCSRQVHLEALNYLPTKISIGKFEQIIFNHKVAPACLQETVNIISPVWCESDPYSKLEQLDLRNGIDVALNLIPLQNRELIKLHYGLNGNQRLSKPRIAQRKNCTTKRVIQVIAKGLKLLKHWRRTHELKNLRKGGVTFKPAPAPEPKVIVPRRNLGYDYMKVSSKAPEYGGYVRLAISKISPTLKRKKVSFYRILPGENNFHAVIVVAESAAKFDFHLISNYSARIDSYKLNQTVEFIFTLLNHRAKYEAE